MTIDHNEAGTPHLAAAPRPNAQGRAFFAARPSSIRVESANAHTGIEIPLSGNLISAKYGCAIYVIRSP